jgi:hypothetical protein
MQFLHEKLYCHRFSVSQIKMGCQRALTKLYSAPM